MSSTYVNIPAIGNTGPTGPAGATGPSSPPAGIDGQIQFNNSGAFGGSPFFVQQNPFANYSGVFGTVQNDVSTTNPYFAVIDVNLGEIWTVDNTGALQFNLGNVNNPGIGVSPTYAIEMNGAKIHANGGIQLDNNDINNLRNAYIVSGGTLAFFGPSTGFILFTNGGLIDFGTTNGTITHLADPTSAQDAATKNYVDTATGNVPQFLKRYGSTTTISGSFATLDFTNSQANQGTGTYLTGEYTCGVSGKFSINAQVAIASSGFIGGDSILMEIQKNSSTWSDSVQFPTNGATQWPISINDVMNCTNGDIIRIRLSTTATGPSIENSLTTKNFLAITKVSN